MATKQRYGIERRLDVPYDEAVERVTAALADEGFGILTEIDVKATLKKKLDEDFRRYVILGSCNPQLAHRAFQREIDIGLLLPCNVIVYEADGGGSVVSILDPVAMMELTGNPELDPIAREARERLARVADAIAA